MISQADYILGRAIALLRIVRMHMIKNQDREGLELLEDEYQSILSELNGNCTKGKQND